MRPESKSTPRLILLPGLGADHRLLAPQRAVFPHLEVPPWLPPLKNETLPAYAARLASDLVITSDTIVGGISFGGMLALEIARLTNPRAVILIASCRHPRAISPAARRFASVGLRIPLPSAAARLAPLAIPALGPMGDAERTVILGMAESAPIPFVRWGGRAILEWQGCEDLRCPVHHIHGRRDRIILWKACGADVVVPGAGHVVNLTHADEVNRALLAFLDRLQAGPASAPARPSPAMP